jgi:hypothetical protein
VVLPLSILCAESRFLISWCASDRYGMAGSVRESLKEYNTWCRGSGLVKYRSGTRWPNDREASKPWSTVSSGLASKPMAAGFPVWASKPADTV